VSLGAVCDIWQCLPKSFPFHFQLSLEPGLSEGRGRFRHESEDRNRGLFIQVQNFHGNGCQAASLSALGVLSTALHGRLVRMDALSQSECLECGCGRTFSGTSPLNLHRRACKSRKRLLQCALLKAKEIWQQRKRRRIGESQVASGRSHQLTVSQHRRSPKCPPKCP
jgi:hypothetical protein